MKAAAGLPQAGRYLARSLAQSLRLMVGLPDYDVYLSHMERTHPGQVPMSYEAFFRERLEGKPSINNALALDAWDA